MCCIRPGGADESDGDGGHVQRSAVPVPYRRSPPGHPVSHTDAVREQSQVIECPPKRVNLRCFAYRWRTPASVTATWLVTEGAAYLFAQEHRRDASWREGPDRWVLPTQEPQRPYQIEIPGAGLQIMVGWLASRCGAGQADILCLTLYAGASV